MPTYDYECAACGRRFEVVHGVHVDGPTTCPLCGEGPIRKVITAANVHYKGSGWAKKERRATVAPGAAGKSGDGDGGGSHGGGSDEAAAKPAASDANDGAKGSSTKDAGSKDPGTKDGGSKDSGNESRGAKSGSSSGSSTPAASSGSDG
jgi:putative FmdB family regulatory protein